MNIKPKVLYIISTTHLGGAPVQAYWLAKNLTDKIELFVVAPNDGPYFQKFKNISINVINLPIRSINLMALKSIINIIRNYNISLIHSHGKAAGLYSRIAGWWTKTSVIHTFHGIHFKKYGILSPIYLMIEKILGKMTKFFIAVAEHEKVTAIKMKFAKSQQIKVIYNAIPPYKSAYQSANNQLTLISVGRFYSGKGQNYLISAMPEIIRNIPKAKLIFIGDGPELQVAKALASQLKVQDNIKFVGELEPEKIYEYLNKATIYVAPSLGEGLPLTLLEAGQVGLPVIATDVSGNSEVIQNEISGLLVPAANSKALAQAIIKLYNNPQLAQKYAFRSQETIQNKFGFNRMINETYNLYQKALS